MSAHIKLWHDFNDRNQDGSYSVWIQPGTRVTLYSDDGEHIEVECVVPTSRFITVVPRAASVLASPQETTDA